MKLSSFIGGKEEEGRFDSFMGNAFIGSAPNHPVINELSRAIKRNLNLESDTPDYIKYPLNKFDSIICSTGPMALTLSYFKIPARYLYSVHYARKETELTMQNPPPFGAIGGDVFLDNWGTKEYLQNIYYPAEFIKKEGREIPNKQALPEAIRDNNMKEFAAGKNQDVMLKSIHPDIQNDPKAMKEAFEYAVIKNNKAMFDAMLPIMKDHFEDMKNGLNNAVHLNRREIFTEMLPFMKEQSEAMKEEFSKANSGFISNILYQYHSNAQTIKLMQPYVTSSDISQACIISVRNGNSAAFKICLL